MSRTKVCYVYVNHIVLMFMFNHYAQVHVQPVHYAHVVMFTFNLC